MVNIGSSTYNENKAGFDIMEGIPRGLSSKFLKAQSIPQARWQSPELIRTHPLLQYDPENPRGKILFGCLGSQLLGIRDDRHILTIAGNRSGKSVMIICNLILYDGSIFILDPKGEHADLTARRRSEMGQDVYVLDPYGRTKGAAKKFRARYNPMNHLNIEDDCVIEDVMQIIDGMIIKSTSQSDPHWDDESANAIKGFILYVKFGSNIPDEKRNLITVRKLIAAAFSTEIIEDEKVYKIPRQIMAGIQHLKNGPNEDIAEIIENSIRGFYNKPADERGSVLSTMNRHTAFLEYRSMVKVLSGHSFDLSDIKSKANGMTLYLCFPATRMDQCKRFLRIMFNQLIVAMETEETIPKNRILGILDEFPVLGFLQQIQDAIGQIASFHFKLWVVCQDWGQGESLYGKRWDSFAANAGMMQSFATIDGPTNEYISRRLGKTAVLGQSQGDTSYDQKEKGIGGVNQSKELHDLLSPSEVELTFGRGDKYKRQLIQLAALNPIICQRVEHYNKEAPYHHIFAGKYDSVKR